MGSNIDIWHFLTGHFNYFIVIILMMTGLYIVIATGNLIKKLVGLGVFQTSVFQLYITISKVAGGQPPILEGVHGETDTSHGETIADHGEAIADHGEAIADHGEAVAEHATTGTRHAASSMAQSIDEAMVGGVLYSNPLPHVLILTAIVVGVATLAVGLALVVRIREAYGSIEEDELQEADHQFVKGAAS